MPPTDVILNLQELLLRAVLLGQLLPGQSESVRLPDLSFVLREPVIYLAEENLAGSVTLTDLAKPLRTLTVDEVNTLARQHGDIPYLYFLAPEAKDDEVRLTLVARIAAQDPNKQPLGLSGVHVIFVHIETGWKVMEDPVYSAF